MVHLQELHERYRGSGLVLLGLNWADQEEIALQMMRENGVTYPNVLDASDAARDLLCRVYACSGVPLNYIIDREGVIADAWYGYEPGHGRALSDLHKLGVVPEADLGPPQQYSRPLPRRRLKGKAFPG